MADSVRWGLDNPHPLSRMKTELVWEGKYDEYGNRRTVDIAGSAMLLQKIETIDESASRAQVQDSLFAPVKAHHDKRKWDSELLFFLESGVLPFLASGTLKDRLEQETSRALNGQLSPRVASNANLKSKLLL